MKGREMARKVLRIGGADRAEFLQGLVTNDVRRLSDGLVYAAILSPQGKYLADFFLKDEGEAILLDADAGQAPGLAQRLGMYRLRAAVTIEDSGLAVRRGTGAPPAGALSDPRHPDLGWRLYGAEGGADGTDFDAIRVAHCIPEAGIELIPNDSFILESGFERLHGVDFRKGCYVGQEVTARMKHKTELRKGLATVEVEGAAPPGTPIETADGKEAGTLYTQSGGRGIAYLRFDRATGPLRAGPATVRLAAAQPAP
jgi:tRNA-modifying protein YgfZ